MAKKKETPPKKIVTLEHLDIVYLPVGDLVPNTYNPNRQSDRDFELLCRSIEEDGFTQPILVRRGTNRIVDGEHRWRACTILAQKDPKFGTVPVVYTDMTDEQAMISTLRHNRARGSEDLSKAADVIRELDSMGALAGAADSLMMDDVELNMFTKDITEAELHLRSDYMSIEQTEETLKQERELEELKAQEELLMAKADQQKYTLQMTYIEDSAYFIKAIIGREQAKGIVELCRCAEDEGFANVQTKNPG